MQPPLPELGHAFLVALEPGLDRSRLSGLFYAIKTCPGVAVVVDMAAISRETLDVFLLPDAYKTQKR